jgi:hypothetical protein
MAAKIPETKCMVEIRSIIDKLLNIKLMKPESAPPYKVQFEGNFELENFASHGIILVGEKIFKVCFMTLSNIIAFLDMGLIADVSRLRLMNQ